MNSIENNKNFDVDTWLQDVDFKDLFTTVTDMFKLMKQYIFVVLAIIVFFIASVYGYFVISYQPIYQSTATFSITPLVGGDSNSGLSVYKFNYTSTFANQMAKTFPYIVDSENLEKAIEYDIGRSMNGTINVVPVTGSNIVKATVKSNSAEDSSDILNSFIKCYPQISEYVFGDTKTNVIYYSDFPQTPINSKNHIIYILYGFAAGLVVAFVLFFILASKRLTIKNKNDVEIKLNSKCICEVPHVVKKRSSKKDNSIINATNKSTAFLESIKVMKKRIKSQLRDKEKVIAITSASFGEGKTTLAYNLSQAFANGDEKVLLIDFDFHKKTLQNHLVGTNKNYYGISDLVEQKATFEQAIIHQSNNFDVLYSGTKQCKLSDVGFKTIFEQLKGQYDYIVVDLPPCGIVSDSALITNLCDVILFVIKSDTVSVDNIKKSLQYILYSKARLLGFVVNDCANPIGSYGRYNYYGRYKSYGYGNK